LQLSTERVPLAIQGQEEEKDETDLEAVGLGAHFFAKRSGDQLGARDGSGPNEHGAAGGRFSEHFRYYRTHLEGAGGLQTLKGVLG
jgi:hypothetical protein